MTSVKSFRAVIITDLDNTLYNWVDYFAPSFRAMVHVLARETGVDEAVITDDFRRVFARHGSVEYSFSVQELDLTKDRSPDAISNLVRLVKGAFSRVRQKNLRAYEGVRETLQWASSENIAVVAATNSARYQAMRRLQQLRLDHHFAGLACWEGIDIPPDDPWAERVRSREESSKWVPKMSLIWTFPTGALKPNTGMYETVLSDLALKAGDAWVIGDSLHKDVAPALAIGARGIWAKYGGDFDAKNFETLLSITDWKQERIDKTYAEDAVAPTFEAESFADLRRFIPSLQGNLFSPTVGR